MRPWSYRLLYLSAGRGAVRARRWLCFRNILRSKIISGIFSILRQVNVSGNLLRSIVYLVDWPLKFIRREIASQILAVWMWSHLLVEKMTGEEHVIFDGTPRSFHEAQIIDTAVTFYNRQRPHVIYLNISRETSRLE